MEQQMDKVSSNRAMVLKLVVMVDKELKAMVMVLELVFWVGMELNPVVMVLQLLHRMDMQQKAMVKELQLAHPLAMGQDQMGGAGSKPMKGYGRPPYGAGPGVGMGTSRGLGVPQLARNQGKVYGSNGYNGHGAQPMGGYNGGYGHAGMGLGSRYGNGGMKGPKQGYNGAAGVPSGQGAKPNGYGYPSAGATKPAKPGYGGPSRGLKPHTTKGVGAVSPSEGTKTLGTGYGAPAGAPNGQFAKAASTGYGMMPNGKATKGAGAFKGLGLKGGVLSPEQPSAAPQEGAVPQQAITQGAAPVAPEPTNGILVMVTQEKYQKLPLPVPQGKSYKQMPLIPQATPEAAPVLPQSNDPKPALEPTPEPAPMGPQGKGPKAATSGPAPVVPQSNPLPEPAAALPQGYVTGNAVPEQKGAETDVLFGVDSTGEGGASPESTKPLKTKVVPETVAAKNTGGIIPEETLTVGVPEVAPEEANIKNQPEAGPDRHGVKGLPAGETGATDSRGGTSLSKGQGAKSARPDCGPSGIPNGQWMKIPRPGYNAGAGASTGTKTKGYSASAGGYSNGGGAKANKPGYGAGGYTVPGLSNGYGAGLRYPYAGNPKQPGYGQGAYLGAGYGNGNPYGGNANVGEAGKSKSGYGNGYSAGVQPDYASLGQGVPAADAKSGGARQIPYNGSPVVPAGLDGISQFEPQSAGLGPNGKLGSMYGGMGGLPFGGQTLGMGTEKSNTKYGIGGLQFGGQPLSTGGNGAGKYGYGGGPYGPTGDAKSSGKYGGLGAGVGGDPAPGKYGYGGFPNGGQLLGLGSNGNIAGKYGYGRMPHEAAGSGPEAKSTGKYGMAGSPYQPESLGLGHNGKLTSKQGGGEVPYAPQALGFGGDAKSAGKYDNQGVYQSQPLESATEVRSGGEYDAAGLPYESLPLEPDSAGKSYVKGELPTPAIAVEGEGVSVDRYENVGYINGQVQPEVVAFPAAPTPSPTLAYPSVPSYPPAESFFTPDVVPGVDVEDLPNPTGTASLGLDSAPATETEGVVQVPEQPDDLQLPRQIHIQQHLKLHFHPQGTPQGAKNGKYDLNGFFGNSGYQG
ncbi:calymmin [Toxotes jaculatrix]|uniref:calymmin n=1 Tax=Toxotes jaculatrix TaxID=941984 RepID=UPI001B3AC198|nr:calymmin [Toxotes jaculatrix]